MRETTNFSFRLDKDLKSQAEKLFNEMGLNMTSAMTLFLRQAVREQGIPFKISARGREKTILDPTDDAYINAMLDEADRVSENDQTSYTLEEMRQHVMERINAKKI